MLALERETGFGRHVLLGHSQGALIAAAVAANSAAHVAGLGLLAGMGLPGREGLLDQHLSICRAEGWSDEIARQSLAQKVALFDILLAAQADIDSGVPGAQAVRELKSNLLAAFLGDADRSELTDEERCDLDLTIDDLLEWECRYLLSVDPVDNLLQVTCPVLAIIGDKDSQVDAARNLPIIEGACIRGQASRVDVHTLADHNHLFQKTSSAALSDYATLGAPFSDDVLSIVRAWLQEIR
jgi:pimeloyl-ACP methyl ester carboxylesterase